MAKIDSLELEITADTKKATQSVDQLAKRLSSLGSSLSALGNTKGIRHGIGTITTAFKQIGNATNKIDTAKIKALSSAINTLGSDKVDKATQNLPKLASAIQQVMSSLNASGDVTKNVTEMTTALTQLVNACGKVGNAQSKLSASTNASTGNTSGASSMQNPTQDAKSSANETINTAKQLGDSLTSESGKTSAKIMSNLNAVTLAFKISSKIIKTSAKATFGYFFAPLTVFIKGLKKALPLLKKIADKFNIIKKITSKGFDLKKFFTNILKYGFAIRSTYVLFKKLRSAVVSAYDRLVVFDAETNKAFSNIKSSAKYLANATASALSPVLKAIEPLITNLIKRLADLMNVFGQFVATLTGKKWIKASYVFEDYATSLGDASDSAKDLNNQLQGFDKLNNLSTSSSSGSSSSDSTGYIAGMFEEGSGTNKFAEMVKKAWENADFTKVGAYIGEKLWSAVRTGIEWLETQANPFGVKFGKCLATLINGAVETGQGGETNLATSIGTLIGNAINTVFNSLDSFVTNVHWDSIGIFIADGFNAFNDSGWMQNIAKTLADGLNGAFQTIGNFADEFDWTLFGATIRDSLFTFLETFDWSNAGESLGKIVSGIATSIQKVVGNEKLWKELGKKLKDGLKSFVSAMNEVDPKTGLNGWATLGKDIHDIVDGLINAINEIFKDKELREELGQAFADFFTELDTTSMLGDLLKLAGNIVKTLWQAMESAFKENPIDIGMMLPAGLGIYEFLKNGIPLEIEKVKELITKVWNGFTVIVGSVFSTTKENVVTWFTNVKKWWGTRLLAISNAFSTVKSTVSGWFTTIKGWWGDKKLSVGSTMSNIWQNVQNWWKTFTDDWGSKNLSIGFSIPNIAETVKSWWSSFTSNWGTKELNVTTKSSKKAKGGSFYGGAWHNIQQYASGGVPNYGTMFVAGESGAEVVGHIGGRTEVLNESQLASVMYDAVVSGMQTAMANGGGVNVYLEGDAQGLFKAVRKQDSQYKKVNGHSAFAY